MINQIVIIPLSLPNVTNHFSHIKNRIGLQIINVQPDQNNMSKANITPWVKQHMSLSFKWSNILHVRLQLTRYIAISLWNVVYPFCDRPKTVNQVTPRSKSILHRTQDQCV